MVRMRIEINGIVQGVGFRPYIHHLVSRYGFPGWVRNHSGGVELELEGEEAALRDFVGRIAAEAPVQAEVDSVRTELLEGLAHYTDFVIEESRRDVSRDTLVPPDIAVCPDCLAEMRDKRDRRFGYPFLNCTNCGPRFTIVRDLPYDRERTSMAGFAMCPACGREYRDPRDRRYHAEPTCCPVCGPRVFFEGDGARVFGAEALERARECVKNGGILCVKGLGGMHLACLPERAALLRRRKRRDEKPFAVMCRELAWAREQCFVSEAEEAALNSFRRPIVLLKKRDAAQWRAVSENGFLGLMLPYTPLHYLLLGEDIDALIMTSANLSERPILFRNDEALRELAGVADGFLLHDREILHRCDDSLIYMVGDREYPIRRSRGYVPYPLRSPLVTGSGLACGAEQKASFSLSRPGYVFASQHIGDLKNAETWEHYRREVEHFRRLFDIRPAYVACDGHPDYLSTRFAETCSEEWGVPLIRVQHHHAHMAACMADNGLTGEVIGLIWDGAGYGTDGSTWGGEFFTGGYGAFRRRGHIRALAMPGGDRAVEEIWRLGYAATGARELFEGFPTDAVDRMLAAGVHCPPSTGMGRLFDAASALLGLCHRASYEGQGAVRLEAAAVEGYDECLPVKIENGVFDWRPLLGELARRRLAGEAPGTLAALFMNTLVSMACAMAEELRSRSGLDRVVLSGGSFQNMYLLARLPAALEARGFQVFTHSRVSCNDEGLSLGQLLVARHVLAAGKG